MMLDLFAGIGGFSIAAERCGIPTAAFCEINPFCRRVLAKHWPEVPIFEDVTKLTADSLRSRGVGRVTGISAGWPCQGNSVAGKRAGHTDERSGLFSEVVRLADELHPEWLLLENVPGLVSVNGGVDFADVIGELRRRDYVGCVRRLDAQHFGLAQRRARLLFVCGLGAAGRRAVHAVLEGGKRYPAPRREAGQVAPSIPSRSAAGGGIGTDFDCDGGLITPPLTGNPYGDHASREGLLIAGTIGANHGNIKAEHAWTGQLVTHSLTADGFDASEDGTGRGTPLIAFDPTQVTSAANYSNPQPGDPCHPLAATAHPAAIAFGVDDASTYEADASSVLSTLRKQVGAEAVAEWGSRILDPLQSPDILRAWLHGASIRCTSDAFRCWVDDRPLPRAEGSPARTLRQVWENGPDGRSSQGRGLATQLAQQLGTPLPKLPQPDPRRRGEIAQVRRLSPTEAERLQGFSWRNELGDWQDGHTCLCGRNRGRSFAADGVACTCPDGPRYRALGNAVAVPVVEWMLRRIAESAPAPERPTSGSAAAVTAADAGEARDE